MIHKKKWFMNLATLKCKQVNIVFLCIINFMSSLKEIENTQNTIQGTYNS